MQPGAPIDEKNIIPVIKQAANFSNRAGEHLMQLWDDLIFVAEPWDLNWCCALIFGTSGRDLMT